MGTQRPLRSIALFVAAAMTAVVVVDASAQEPVDPSVPESTSTTTSTIEPGGSSTTTTRPGTPSTAAPTSTTTTVPYVPVLPPELAADPRAPFLVDPGELDIPLAQLSFDPLSVGVAPELVEGARLAVLAAQTQLMAVQAEVALHSTKVGELERQLGALDGKARTAVQAAANAKRQLQEHAVAAYIAGPVDDKLAMLSSHDYVDMGVAKSYVDVVVDTHERLVRNYERRRDALSDDNAVLASTLADARSELKSLTDEVAAAYQQVLDRVEEQRVYEAGARAYIEGFVFPVAGDVEFIDSWGYPRMTGTASAHWHQGTDIFAQQGTPLIASENGVLERIGTGTLGGNKLWVKGDSGNEYYYAHLSAFAEGIANGQQVRAGEVVGYVGDTGNARGTSPHLHFEIHPGGVGPANPYPLLKAAYGNRPVARAVAPTTTTAPPTTLPAAAPPAGAPARPGG